MSLALIRKAVPEADDTIVDYIEGYLREGGFEDDDAIHEFVKPMLIDAGGNEEQIDLLCDELRDIYIKKGK